MAITGPDKSNNNKENRKIEPIPEITIKTIITWPNKFDTWYRNNFGGRIYLVETYEKVMLDIFKTNYIFNAIIGEDNYLFSNQYINDYRKPILFNDQELDAATDYLEKTYLAFKAKGIGFAFIIVPSKPTAVPQYLPAYIKPLYSTSNNVLLKQRMKDKGYQCPIVYLGDTLIGVGKTKDTYQKYDTHWNDFGALIGFNYMVNHTKTIQNIPQITEKSVKWSTMTITSGDIGRSIDRYSNSKLILQYPTSLLTIDSVISPEPTTPIKKGFHFSPDMYYYSWKTRDQTKPDLLLFRDSYATSWYKYFKHRYHKTTMVWDYQINYTLINEVKPKVILLEAVEMNLRAALLNEQNSIH